MAKIKGLTSIYVRDIETRIRAYELILINRSCDFDVETKISKDIKSLEEYVGTLSEEQLAYFEYWKYRFYMFQGKEKAQKEKAEAEKVKVAADNRYTKAKDELNAAEMIKAKAEADAAAEVLQMFTDALNKAERSNAFSYDEVVAKYAEFSNINEELTTEANKAICVLLAQIEEIVNKADKAAADLDTIFDEINGNTASCGALTAGQLVQNMRISCNNTRQYFAEYWPKK